jgi:hypothetical protein
MKITSDKILIRFSGNDNAEIAVRTENVASFESFQEDASNVWDQAHTLYREKKNDSDIAFIEPDIVNSQPENFPNLQSSTIDDFNESFGNDTDFCARSVEYDAHWPRPQGKKEIWHLKDAFSQLADARTNIAQILQQRTPKTIVRIAHFDTGYDSNHVTFPKDIIRHDLQKNFTGDGPKDDASDEGAGLNGGHGCGTLSVLAGKAYDNNYGFKDSIGLSKEQGIEIVPVRIAHSVVLFRSRAFEEALQYIIDLYANTDSRCHIITMSMGGAPTRNWAKLVNKAYDLGIFIVAAAGNNFGGVTPRTLVYPARFNRVIAACGITMDNTPYYKFDIIPQLRVMQGNYGPRRMMRTAISAYTPNIPWARYGCSEVVDLSGAGTSSATPQIAATAALYYQKYFQEIENSQEGWQKVELIRKALFVQAGKVPYDDAELYFGNGVVKANKMLDILPDTKGLQKEGKDTVFFPILQILAEIVVSESFIETSDTEQEMFELEISQLILTSPELQEFLNTEEKQLEELTFEERREFILIIISLPDASESLKKYLLSLAN